VTDQTTNIRSKSIRLAGEMVAAYVKNNPVPVSQLPSLIGSVHGAFAGLPSFKKPSTSHTADAAEKPALSEIRKSVRHDGIVSFLDGRTYKTLRRHLTAYGLHPQSYRDRFGLPADYPMVAPSYAAHRSALAKAIGLGRPGAMRRTETRAGAGPSDEAAASATTAG
jgi:predicted transcriptional regulator